MHVTPVYAHLQILEDLLLSVKDSIVNYFLFLRETATRRERDCDIATIAMILSSHICENQFVFAYSFIILNVMQRRRSNSACANALVGCKSAAAIYESVIFEKRLDLELFVAVTDFAEAVFVSLTTETRNVANDIDFLRGFSDTRFIKDVEKLGVVARVLLQEGKIRYLERAF